MAKDTLYTIPVNDAFDTDCECPVCKMYESIENDAVTFTLGPSYMEDDIRLVTNKKGFCKTHIAMLYKHQNRLGLGLMLDTHLETMINNIEKLAKSPVKAPSFFKKNVSSNTLADYIEEVSHSCYICDRINVTFDRYIATIFHMYRNDSEFAGKIASSKGFCNEHFSLLYNAAADNLSGRNYEEFISCISNVYIDNLKRIKDEVEWFTDKFDYRNQDAPWKNSKDALPRAIQKLNSIDLAKE